MKSQATLQFEFENATAEVRILQYGEPIPTFEFEGTEPTLCELAKRRLALAQIQVKLLCK